MARHSGWPTWKVIAVMTAAAAGAVGFWVLGMLVNRSRQPAGTGGTPQTGANFTLGSMLQMFSLLCVGVALILGGSGLAVLPIDTGVEAPTGIATSETVRPW